VDFEKLAGTVTVRVWPVDIEPTPDTTLEEESLEVTNSESATLQPDPTLKGCPAVFVEMNLYVEPFSRVTVSEAPPEVDEKM
tara:strand:- start:681 stop:926 length:246 start_codon:yes stop_codon:yes gene_type:complete